MKIVVVRRVRGSTHSLDIYADNLVAGLKSVRPKWTVIEVEPRPWNSRDKLWMSGTGIRKYYECYWRYPKEVTQLQADIFHIVDQTDGHIARWLSQVGQRTVVTCHDLVQLIQPERQSRFLALSLAVWRNSVKGMRQANHVVTVSSNTALDVQKLLGISPKKVSVVLNGVEPHFQVMPGDINKCFREKYSESQETICLLHVGGTHQRKNILTILKVLVDLRAQGQSACLWKAGSDFTLEQKDFIYKHKLDKYITYFNNPSKEILISLYNAADILLSPSFYEGFGLTILEAMACGTPVITSNVSSLPEVAGDAAILLNPSDVKSMVNKIIQLDTDYNYRKELIKRGLLRSQSFTWEKSAEKIADIYEKLAQQ